MTGWTERKRKKAAEPVRHKGVLDGFEVGRKEAEEMIMSARVLAGWISADDLVQPEAAEPEGDVEAEAEADTDTEAETEVAADAGAADEPAKS